MHSLPSLPTLLSILTYTAAASTGHQHPLNLELETARKPPLPLLIWHGLGDQYDNEGLRSVGDLAQDIHPDTYVYYIRLDADGSQDRQATFLGNLTEQIEQVCGDIRNDTKLWERHDENNSSADTDGKGVGQSVLVDALGFSQGGQFLRGLIERCDGLRVRSLMTFGSQHNGISSIKACGTWDFLCKGALALMKGNAYSDYVQGRVVPAQYYRTLNDTASDARPADDYIEHSNFLADVNNERPHKNPSYATRLARLQHFVMVVFEHDTTVIPKESGWFAEVNATSGDITPLRQRALYREDWLGLKRLDAQGGLVLETTPGDHMQLDDEVLGKMFATYFGPERDFLHDNNNDENKSPTTQQQPRQKETARPCSGKKRNWERKMAAWRRAMDAPIKEYL